MPAERKFKWRLGNNDSMLVLVFEVAAPALVLCWFLLLFRTTDYNSHGKKLVLLVIIILLVKKVDTCADFEQQNMPC